MLMKATESCLLIVDVQEKLIPAVQEPQKLIDNCAWLIQVAQLLNVPVLASEQYPKGLGSTVNKIKGLLEPDVFMEKVHFSCTMSEPCRQKIEASERQQVVIAGIEAHVCVLQTAIGLLDLDNDKEVFVVADAISSRNGRDMELGIQRMREVGVNIVTKEMVLFEWAHQSATPLFKQLSKQFLQ